MTTADTISLHHQLEGPESALDQWETCARTVRSEGIPDAQLVIFPQARHLANVEQPEEITRAVLGHLDPLSARREDL